MLSFRFCLLGFIYVSILFLIHLLFLFIFPCVLCGSSISQSASFVLVKWWPEVSTVSPRIKLHLLVVLCILVEVHAVEWGERTYARETVCQLPLQHKVFCVFNEFAGRNLHTYNIQTFKHTYILYIHIYKHICMYVSSIWFLTTRKHLHICNETASSCVAPHLTKSKDIK